MIGLSAASGIGPEPTCSLCPRLVEYRQENRDAFPDWHNGPVASFGGVDSELLIVGLAPGLRGANRTGRPFTGDFAGDLLYPTLISFGFAAGQYGSAPDDGLELLNCRITNAVRCVPPANKPVGAEVSACREFLTDEITAMKGLKVVLALGAVAHGAVLSALGERKASSKFAHNALHDLPNGLKLADSYHCSRYNTNTGRLTVDMFHDVFSRVRAVLDDAP